MKNGRHNKTLQLTLQSVVSLRRSLRSRYPEVRARSFRAGQLSFCVMAPEQPIMSRMNLIAALTLWTVAGITVLGCGNGTQSTQSAKVSSRNQNPKSEVPDNDAERSQTYVTCRATLTAFKKDYQWFDDSTVGHDDGVAPLASFVLAEPSPYTARAMGIVFKYSADDATTLPPDEADIGRQFSVQIPEDFLKGKSNNIDNLSVRHFRKIEP